MDFTFVDMADVSGVLMADHVWLLRASEGWYVLDRKLGYVVNTNGVGLPYPIRIEYDGWFRDTETALKKSNEWLKLNRCLFYSFEEALVCWQQRQKALGCAGERELEFPTDEPVPCPYPPQLNRITVNPMVPRADSTIGWVVCFWLPLVLLLMKGLSR